MHTKSLCMYTNHGCLVYLCTVYYDCYTFTPKVELLLETFRAWLRKFHEWTLDLVELFHWIYCICSQYFIPVQEFHSKRGISTEIYLFSDHVQRIQTKKFFFYVKAYSKIYFMKKCILEKINNSWQFFIAECSPLYLSKTVVSRGYFGRPSVALVSYRTAGTW